MSIVNRPLGVLKEIQEQLYNPKLQSLRCRAKKESLTERANNISEAEELPIENEENTNHESNASADQEDQKNTLDSQIVPNDYAWSDIATQSDKQLNKSNELQSSEIIKNSLDTLNQQNGRELPKIENEKKEALLAFIEKTIQKQKETGEYLKTLVVTEMDNFNSNCEDFKRQVKSARMNLAKNDGVFEQEKNFLKNSIARQTLTELQNKFDDLLKNFV